jgi:hypothetical protein
MPRSAGEKFGCDSCGAVVVYEQGCSCTDETHVENCCGKQMSRHSS